MSNDSVDDRIVSMSFKTNDFIAGAQRVLAAISRLKEGLKFEGATKGINDISQAGGRFNLGGMGAAVDHVANRFNVMRVVAFAAISNITNRALNAGINLVKAFTIDPIKQGLDVYETKINAIQTILANTKTEGTNLSQVTAALNQLNLYANKTVYNFGQMAHNIGTFTAAGVNLKTSVESIKGIANLAALSGSSAEQASSAMYQLSQAIAAGRVKLQDWNSVVNAGLGGKVFQNALIETARVNGVEIDKILAKNKGFRNSLQTGWLTANILTQTLAKFTGDLSASQLKALGYTKQQSAAILAQAKLAEQSATKIRTMTQLQAALREEVATAWAGVWEALIGNINSASTLLTKVHNTLENAFTNPLKDLSALLRTWVQLGGRDELIQAIGDAFRNLGRVIEPVKEAFRDVFPPLTAQTLVNLTVGFETFVERLRLSSKGMEELRRTFDGVFSVIKIVLDVIKGLFTALGQTSSAVKTTGTGILGITANIGDFLVHLRKTIESGTALNTFFTDLGKVLSFPIKLLDLAGGAIAFLAEQTQKAFAIIGPYISKIAHEFGNLGTAIIGAIKSGNITSILAVINQVLFGGVLLAVRKFFTSLGKGGDSKGLFSTIKESFESLTNTLKTMQTALKSETLLKIASAVGILTASVVALSFIDTAKLGKALAAISLMFIQLLAAMAVVQKISASGGIIKMGSIAGALILLSTAILVLSAAVAILSRFSWQELARGLSAIGGLLTGLVISIRLMSGSVKGLLTAAIAMNGIAIAINILAGAVALLGHMNISTLLKGVGTITALLVVIAGFNKIGGGEQLIATAASMVILAGALNIMSIAIKSLGELSVATLVRGVLTIAGALVVIAVAMRLMPEGMLSTAASLLIVSAALDVIGTVISKLGVMSWGSIAKALVALAGSLIIIAAAMSAMTEAIAGAAALIVVAGALAILTPVLIALSSIPWEGIAKALVGLAGVFLVIAGAGLLLTPLVPTLLALGAAILLMGLGIGAAGAGVAAFAIALSALAVGGAAAIGVLVAAVTSLGALIPKIAIDVGNGIVALANTIARGVPAIVKAIAAILTAILEAIIKIAPKARKAFEVVLNNLLQAIDTESPKVIATMIKLINDLLTAIQNHSNGFSASGTQILVNFLQGIADRLGRVITAGTNIIIAFIQGIGRADLRIAVAALNTILTFLRGLDAAIKTYEPLIIAEGFQIASDMVTGMIQGLAKGAGGVASAAVGVAKNAWDHVTSFLGINSPSKKFIAVGEGSAEGWALGWRRSSSLVTNAAVDSAKGALDAFGKTLSNLDQIISDNIDLRPTITPVLDLSKATAGFSSLAAMSKTQLISANVSASKASAISADNAAAAARIGTTGVTSVTNFAYTQNNTSPKALSTVDIYRQTRNQLSTVREALPI